MRQFLIWALIALFAGDVRSQFQVDSDREPYIFEDVINSTIQGIRDTMPDPLVIDNLTITVPPEITVLTGSADLSNFELTGLSGFLVPYLNLAVVGMRLNFTLVLPSMNINTDYWADLLIADLLPLYGNGKANIHLVDVEIQGSAQANLTTGVQVQGLRVQITLGPSTFDIHGALDNEDFSAILSELLNDIVTTFIDNHQDVISNIISPILELILNEILGGTDVGTTPAAA